MNLERIVSIACINVVFTHLINSNDLEITYLDKMGISDHVPIRVKLKHDKWEWRELNLQRFIKNKKFMRKISLNVLDRLYLADNLQEIKDAFSYR